MPRGLRGSFAVVDGLMLFYWAASALMAAGLVQLPAEMMYAGYGLRLVDAWNWSFLPLDLLLAVTGLAAVHLDNRGDPRWRPLAIVSLTLTFAAGLMAVAFWTLTGDFDPAWWIPNLGLMAVGLFWLPRVMR